MKAGELLGLAQSDVSAIVNGRVYRFSLERLLRIVRELDREVTIVTRPKLAASGQRSRMTKSTQAGV